MAAFPAGEADEAGSARSLTVAEFGYVSADGVAARVPLTAAARVSFESCAPVRGFPSRKGQRHLSGRWWSATTGRHVGYESWLERDQLMLLDFDPDVVGIGSQPFWLHWTTAENAARCHAPDYFARQADGSAQVLDCRPPERIRPRDAAAFTVTETVCGQLGWGYRVVGAADPVTTGNVRWLSGYRHPRHHQPARAAALHQVCSGGVPLLAAAEAVGDPTAVLPVLFHLLWRHELTTDLTAPLHPLSVVRLDAATTAELAAASAA